MAIILSNGLNFASAGTAITTAGSGAGGNSAFSSVSGTPIIAASGMHDTGGDFSGNAVAAMASWTGLSLTNFAWRGYVKLASAPSVLMQGIALRNGSTTITGLNYATSGRLTLLHGGGGAVSGLTLSILDSNKWYRCEIWGVVGTTTSNSELHYRMYEGDNTTAIDSYDSTTENLGLVPVTNILMGKPGTSGQVSVLIDDLAIADTAAPIGIPSSVVNHAPMANAGPDQSDVLPGIVVTLDGTASIDDDGDSITYAWVQTAGTSVSLMGPTTARPSFTAPSVPGATLTFQLTVSDGSLTDTDTVTVTIGSPASPSIIRSNSFSFAAPGTVITTVNSDSSTDTAFSSINGSPTVLSGGMHQYGADVTGDGATASLLTWSSLPSLMSFSSRYYFKLGAAPSALAQLHMVRSGTTTVTGNNLTTSNQITLLHNGGGAVRTSPTLTSGNWYRVEIWGQVGATTTNGELHYRLFDGDSLTALDTYDSTTENLGTTSITNSTLGKHATSTVYPAGLYVDDWALASTNTQIGIPDVAPIANAGIDQMGVEPFATVMLDGSASLVGSGSSLSYSWMQNDGTTVTLTGATTATPTFIAPATIDGDTLTFELAVDDGINTSMTDTVSISVAPHTFWEIADDSGVPVVGAPINVTLL